MMIEAKKYRLFIHGMHCQACVILTSSELSEHPKVSSAQSSLITRSVEIDGDFGDMTLEEIAQELTPLLSQHKLSTQQETKKTPWKEFALAFPVAVGFILFFILLQKLGIVNLINAQNVTYGTAFFIGIIASLSTCMAVVGGLVLSMSATFARNGEKLKPQALFHIGRLISFFVLGGVIGAVGSAFQFTTSGMFILSLALGIIMLILGINLLDTFGWAKRLQLSMPKSLSQKALNLKKVNHTLTPALIGIVTFFLPCGFTQSMQIYTLSTGNFLQGGITMLFFALGTFPILALISFSSFSIQKSSQAGIFFKSAGLVVIFFALFNIINSFVSIGLIPPFFNL